MPEEIEVGDWIRWPGVLGQDQGKVMSVRHDSYVVQTKTGSAPAYTTVARSRDVSKIPSAGTSFRHDRGESTGAAI